MKVLTLLKDALVWGTTCALYGAILLALTVFGLSPVFALIWLN